MKWEAEWKGGNIYIEINKSSYAYAFVMGRTRTRCLFQYGNQIVERRNLKEPLLGRSIPSIDLNGYAKQPDGQEAHFHARITSKLLNNECELKVNSKIVEVQEIY